MPATNFYSCIKSLASLLISMLVLCCSLCHVVPGLAKLLLPRINPFALISCAGALALVVTHILIDVRFVQHAVSQDSTVVLTVVRVTIAMYRK